MSITDRDDWIYFPEVSETHWLDETPKPYTEHAPREYDNLDPIPEFESVIERDGSQFWDRRPAPFCEEPAIVVDPAVVATREEVR